MSIFWCDAHCRHHDSDYSGFVVTADGREVCYDCDPANEEEDQEWEAMTLAEKREAMGGEYGGDGRDD